MPLAEPPVVAGSLDDVPAEPLRRHVLFRVWRARGVDGTSRPSPWWFASVTDDPLSAGRFDLPAPMGTCYTATRPSGALLEALQAHLTSLPTAELRVRRLARLEAPSEAPSAARLTAKSLAGRYGMTAAVWSGSDRALTQRWAFAFRRDGWWALYAGVQHDPSGRLRAVALFDHGGSHPPTTGGEWPYTVSELTTYDVIEELARYGVEVREPGDLPLVEPPDWLRRDRPPARQRQRHG